MLWISRQVLREFMAVLSRPQTFAAPRSAATIVERVRYLQAHFWSPMIRRWLPRGCSAWCRPSLWGASRCMMQAYGIGHLLTLNVVGFTRFSSLITVLTLEDVLEGP